MPSQLDAISYWGIGIIGFTMVAAVGASVIKLALDDPDGNPNGWLSKKQREELEGKYGYWAVQTALGVVPHGDIKAVEREAKRLSESRFYRR